MAALRRVRARIWIALLLLLGLGLTLMWVSGLGSLAANVQLSAILAQVGAVLVATAVLSVLWESLGREQLASDVLQKAGVGSDMQRAGLVRVTDQYLDDVEWESLFRRVRRLDIFVAYASTWRHAQHERLRAVASDSGARIRVFLPDPDDEATIANLADRFSITPVAIRGKVHEARSFFEALRVPRGADLTVFKRRGDHVFSLYRFDNRAVVTLYSHGKSRTPVPTFVVDEGQMFRFVYDEVNAIHSQSSVWKGDESQP